MQSVRKVLSRETLGKGVRNCHSGLLKAQLRLCGGEEEVVKQREDLL